MKRNNFILVLTILIVGILFNSCKKENDNLPAEKDRYSFWRGDIENFYYVLDMNNQKLHLVKGKPFMVLEYDPLTGVPLRCEFGLSEARNEYLTGTSGAIPEPFLSASSLQYAQKLGISGSVSLLSNWSSVTTNTALSAGGFEFSIDKGSNMYGHEIHNFTFTFDDMAGEIENNTVSWGGRVSDIKAFKLIRKFNSSSLN